MLKEIQVVDTKIGRFYFPLRKGAQYVNLSQNAANGPLCLIQSELRELIVQLQEIDQELDRRAERHTICKQVKLSFKNLLNFIRIHY